MDNANFIDPKSFNNIDPKCFNNNVPEGAVSPIVFKPVPEALKGIQNKRPEEKLYMIAFYYGEDEKGFELCIGRMECYDTISRLMATYSDLKVFESVVMVETLAVNRDNVAEWVMKHPHNSPTLYEFCKYAEKFFPNSDFHIDDYVSTEQIESAEKETRTPTSIMSGVTMTIPITPDDEITRAYKDIMEEKETESKNE